MRTTRPGDDWMLSPATLAAPIFALTRRHPRDVEIRAARCARVREPSDRQPLALAWRAAAFGRGCPASLRPTTLARLDPSLGNPSMLAKEILLHLLLERLARPRVSHVQPIVVHQQRGMSLPHLPGFRRHFV